MTKRKGKDPACLFYWDNWNSGTSRFSRHLKGCYMDLLHSQFQDGPLSLEEIKTVLGPDFGYWPALQKKFAVDETGKYFNERLEQEKEKRAAYTKSRRANLEGVKPKIPDKDNHINPHMGEHMGIGFGTGIGTGIELGGAGGRGKVFSIITKETVETWRQSVLADGPFVDLLCMKGKISLNQFPEVEQEFFKRKLLTGEWKEWENESKMRGNFLNWMPIYGEKQRNKKNGTAKNNGNLGPTGVKVDPYAEFGTV